MAEESFQLPSEQNLDYHIIQLFDRLETMRRDKQNGLQVVGGRLAPVRPSMQAEIRTVEFWRSIISECLASFLYVFIVCGAAAGSGVGASVSSVLLATALASGFTVATLTQCFSHISGAHINPAVTMALTVTRAITPLRTVMYITAQCGGGIAGAALLYGVTVPGYQGNLQAAISHSSTLAAWERFGIEFILTFTVVLAYFVSTTSYKRVLGTSSMVIGAAYSACSFVSMPYLNPARSLGPSFVLNKWDNHWVYWFGPLCGGAACGLIYEYIFNPNRINKNRDCDNDSSSVQSDDEMDYHVDMKDAQMPKFQGGPVVGYNGGYQRAQNVAQQYSAGPPTKIERAESIYGGTRSMYCKSPPLTRANLNRSQSVYAKSQTAINRDLGAGGIPRPGPLVPAQSLYPLRVTGATQNSHVQNQNVQNQLNQRSESIYGIRSSMRQPSTDRSQVENQQNTNTGPMTGFQPVYGTTRQCVAPSDMPDSRQQRTMRPESMYGTSAAGGRNRGQSAQSDDSSYGSYHGTNSSITPTAVNQRNGQQQQQQQPPPPMCGPNSEEIPMQTYSTCSRGQQHQQHLQQHAQQSSGATGKSNGAAGGVPPPPMVNGCHQGGGGGEREQQQRAPMQNYRTHQDIYGQTPIACPPPPPPLQHQYAMHSLRQQS